MKKDIVLVRPFRYQYKSSFISTQEPINLCYLAAYLEKEGYKVSIWDLEQSVINDDEFIAQLEAADPFIVGFNCYTPTISSANKLASLVRVS